MCDADSSESATQSRDEEENRAYRRAILAYADVRFEAPARKTVHALTQYRASGIFGDEDYNSLWDEYCHEVQHGPHDALEYAWRSLVDPILIGIVDAPPPTELVLLTLAANDILRDEQEDIFMWDAIFPDNIREAVLRELRGIAMNRNLERIRWRPRRAMRERRGSGGNQGPSVD